MKNLLGSVALALTLSGAASAATIVNGSFESNSGVSGSFRTLLAGNTTGLTGWTVGGSGAGGGVDLIKTYWAASNGAFSLDMNALNTGSIAQTITNLIVGRTYVLSFDLAGNPDLPGTRSLGVTVGDESGTYSFNTTGHTKTNMGWSGQTFSFTAGAGSELLTFASLNRFAWGPALDNVSVALAPVPLPAGAVLMVGALGALGVARRKRKA